MVDFNKKTEVFHLSSVKQIEDIDDGHFLVDGEWFKADKSLEKLFVRRNRSLLQQSSIRFTYQNKNLLNIIDLYLRANIDPTSKWDRYLLDGSSCFIKGNLFLEGSGIIVKDLYIANEIFANNQVENSFHFLNVYSGVKHKEYTEMKNQVRHFVSFF